MKRLWSIILAVALVLSLVACSSGKQTEKEAEQQTEKEVEQQAEEQAESNSEQEDAGDQAQNETKQNVTLTLMGSEDCFSDVELELYKEFEEETGIVIELITNPNDMNNSILGAKIATKELPDIVAYFNGEGGRTILMPEDNFLPITNDPCLANVNKEMMDTYLNWGGEVYGFPNAGVQNWGILYNKQVFEDLNLELPTTFDELDAICQKIKDAGITPIYLSGGDAWPTETWLDTYWGAYISAKEPDFWERYAKNEVKLAELPEAVECLQRQLDFFNKGYYGDTPLSDMHDGMYGALYEGQAAMFVFGDHVFAYGAQKYPDFTEKIGLMPFPVDGGGYYAVPCSEALYINKDSEHIDEALQLFNFLARPENVEKQYNAEQQACYFNDVTLDLIPQIQEASKQVQSGKLGRVWFDYVPASYSHITYDVIPEMLLGNMTPEQVLKAIDDEIAKNAKAQGLEGW